MRTEADRTDASGTENWVFLGDSLTEGVGAERISYVSALVDLLRAQGRCNVHEARLRYESPRAISRFVAYNVAGRLMHGPQLQRRTLWLWNLAAEGTTSESDMRWVSLIHALRPRAVVIFRGALESVLRPHAIVSGNWPWWVPRSWRGYAAMDPRCYFSASAMRRAKQRLVDTAKQAVRLRLLRQSPGQSLESPDNTVANIANVLAAIRHSVGGVVVCGMLPISEKTFPRSTEQLKSLQAKLENLCAERRVAFLDWQADLERSRFGDYFFRDGFHPNLLGAKRLAELLRDKLEELGISAE